MARSKRLTLAVSSVFIVTFVAGLALLGELAGSVGEPDAWFIRHFDSSSERLEDITGAILLVVAAIALLGLIQQLVAEARVEAPGELMSAELARAAGVLTSFGILLAALAFLTVPLSINIGELYGDSAFVEGRATFPQFGYVALTVGAMVPAAVMIVAIARLQTNATWLRRLSNANRGAAPRDFTCSLTHVHLASRLGRAERAGLVACCPSRRR